MVITPYKAWHIKYSHPKDKSAKSQHTIWQPENLYIQVSSNSGCQFGVSAVFVEEEEAEEKRANATMGTNEKAMSNLIRD